MSEERIVNGVNVDRLFDTINAIKDTPGLARFRFRAQNTWVRGGHNRTTITGFYGACAKQTLTEPLVLEADEPPVLLGEGAEANPMDYVLAGLAADRMGRTRVTMWSLGLSGTCAVGAGFFYSQPGLLTALCLVWGFAVVADSAQFSAAVSELTDPRYVGTALTLQTSLGFLLTLFTLRLIPPFQAMLGWERVFMLLAAGPVLGIWSMLRLRSLLEAARMASGRR